MTETSLKTVTLNASQASILSSESLSSTEATAKDSRSKSHGHYLQMTMTAVEVVNEEVEPKIPT